MPSYEPPSWKRWEPPLCWAPVLLNSPRTGRTYRVKYPYGEPFEAFLDEDHRWYKVDDRATMLPTTGLKYETPLIPSVRL